MTGSRCGKRGRGLERSGMNAASLASQDIVMTKQPVFDRIGRRENRRRALLSWSNLLFSAATERGIIRCMIWPKSTVTCGGVLLFLFCVQTVLQAQTVPQAAPIPETGYVSDSRYVNAFFGFLLPLPQGVEFRDFALPSKGRSHSIFGLQAQRKGLTALTVSATQPPDNSTDDARKAATGGTGASVKKVEIGGKEFWKSESEDHSRAGTMHTFICATEMSGYTLQFTLMSYDEKLAKELRRDIESITFIDPPQARILAGANARLYPAKVEALPNPTVSPTHIAQLKLGVVSGNTYTNDMLGLSFQFPPGWVVADKATQDKVVEAGHQFAYGNDPAAARQHEITQECSRILLWASQYPEGTKPDEINPLVAIMAFDSACLPGVHLPTSTGDVDAIRQLGMQIAEPLSGTPFIGKGQNTIRAFMLENRMMVALSSGFKVNLPARNQPLDVFSSVIFTEGTNYWVVWLFKNGSQPGLDELMKTSKIAFVPPDRAIDQRKTN